MASKEDKLKAKILKMGPAAAINAGLMKKKSGEVMGPGKLAVGAARAIAKKVATDAAKKAAAKAAAKKAAAKTAKITKNSVKVKPGTKPGSMDDARRKSANQAATNTAAARKSGEMANITGSRVNTNPAAGRTGNERIVIKINSAKAVAKVKKKALKAANKPVKSKDANLINRNNPYARSAILSEKPARANRTRLGKDAFKSK
jgi:hypothetical protein